MHYRYWHLYCGAGVIYFSRGTLIWFLMVTPIVSQQSELYLGVIWFGSYLTIEFCKMGGRAIILHPKKEEEELWIAKYTYLLPLWLKQECLFKIPAFYKMLMHI